MGLDQSVKHDFKHIHHDLWTKSFVFGHLVRTIWRRPHVSNAHQSTPIPPLLHPDPQLHLVTNGIRLDLLLWPFPGTRVWRHFYIRPLCIRVHYYGDNDPAVDQVLVHLQVETRGRTQRRLRCCLRHPRQPGVNFTNNLWASFKHADPQKGKKDWCIFCAFGIYVHKCSPKTLMKLIPGVIKINMFTHSFCKSSSQKCKNLVKPSVSFCPFRICTLKRWV